MYFSDYCITYILKRPESILRKNLKEYSFWQHTPLPPIMPSYNHHNRHISTNKNAHSSGYFYIITYVRQMAVVWRPRLRKAIENTHVYATLNWPLRWVRRDSQGARDSARSCRCDDTCWAGTLGTSSPFWQIVDSSPDDVYLSQLIWLSTWNSDANVWVQWL